MRRLWKSRIAVGVKAKQLAVWHPRANRRQRWSWVDRRQTALGERKELAAAAGKARA